MKKNLLFVASLMTAIGAQAQSFTNAGFETWESISVGTPSLTLEHPTAWFGSDSLVAAVAPLAALGGYVITPAKQLYQSSDTHDGDAAALITTVAIGSTVGNAPGVLTNAELGIDLASAMQGNVSDLLNYVTYSGGTDVTATVDTVTFWAKAGGTNQDTAFMQVYAYDSIDGIDSIIGLGGVYITPSVTAYTQFSVPLTYTDTSLVPSKIIVVFVSSLYGGGTTTDGNELYVDDASFTYKAGASTSIRQPLLGKTILVYPNPVSNRIYFNLNPSVKPSDYTLTVSDVTGKVVRQRQLTTFVNEELVSGWAKGTYFYQLSNVRSNQTEKGKFVVE
ncbi:MAG: T9SS type A sorting domain-containing protein [Edaphocola sp.]